MARLLDLFREALGPLIAEALRQARPADSPPQQPGVPPSAPSTVTGVDLKPADQLKAADFRVALLTGKLPENSGLLVDRKTFASLISISTATFDRLQAEGALPAPVRIGHLKKWRLIEVLEWIDADCPPESVWVHMREVSSRKKGK
jgi:predicted DNA-binding transcriptional regulator AlpA